ncbi:MAG: hypothetical protein ACYTGH_13850, partial [Planctomycetota bacterium]
LLPIGFGLSAEIDSATLGERVLRGEKLNRKEKEFLKRYRRKAGMSEAEAGKKLKEYWEKSEKMGLQTSRRKRSSSGIGSGGFAADGSQLDGILMILGLGLAILVVVLFGCWVRQRLRLRRIERSMHRGHSSSDLLLGKTERRSHRS